jgi:hypothetical protein
MLMAGCGVGSNSSNTRTLPSPIRVTPSLGASSVGIVSGSPEPSVAHGLFTVTGTSSNGQDMIPLTLLPDGRVFLVGPYANSAEIYDPATGDFSVATIPTSLHGDLFTALGDGRLLCSDVSGSTFAVFDPLSGAVNQTGSMVVAQPNATSTLLADGRVLFTGGAASGGHYLNEAQIYDPVKGTFSLTGPMGVARNEASSVLLSDGRVLVAGGDEGSSGSQPTILASAELYDPATGQFSLTGSMLEPRSQFGADRLSDGRVLIAGGLGVDTQGLPTNLATAETYDPAAGTFSRTGSMAATRVDFEVTRLIDGRILVAGGSDKDGGLLATAELFDPQSGSFQSTGSMHVARSPNGILLKDGRVFVTGGDHSTVAAELYWP